MKPEIKNHLDLRLAKGEINQEEYASLLKTLSQSNTASPPVHSPGVSEALSKLKNDVFGSNDMIVPTDVCPLAIEAETILFSKHFTHKGRNIPYSEIKSLNYSSSRHTVNLVPVSIGSILTIELNDETNITISTSTMMIRGKKSKLIENAYVFLRKLTFNQRLCFYTKKMAKDGFIQISNAKIFHNGDVEQGEVRLNIGEAHKMGAFAIGTEAGWVKHRTYNPNEVMIGASKFGTSKLGGVLEKRIIFELFENQDVLKAYLHYLADRKSI